MKSSVAIFLFAFMAGLRADDFEELLLADDAEGEVPDRHPYMVCMGHLLKFYIKSFQATKKDIRSHCCFKIKLAT